MKAIEQLRSKVVSELHQLQTFSNSYAFWQQQISHHLGTNITGNSIIDLGKDLSQIFKSTSSGRTQSSVSGGGTAWESLVCWYLNLTLLGSRTVIIKAKQANIPKSISDSISVVYQGSFKSNTESDLLAITFPDDPVNNTTFSNHKDLMEALDDSISRNFNSTELTIIQCKTNWNDNSQIPMLWDLIYSATGFSRNVHVGTNGRNPTKLGNFSYAFVTVPTSRGSFKSISTPVMRVRNLTGGNYWGRETESGVAANVYDMVQRNFTTSFNNYQNGWFNDIPTKISIMKNSGNVFKI